MCASACARRCADGSVPTPATKDQPFWIRPAVVVILALHALLALWAVAGKSVTADEILHVTSGYFFNRYGDYRVQPENGNLPQRLAGLPAALAVDIPPALARSPAWQGSDSWVISRQFFYGSGFDHWPLLMAGRSLMLVFSLGTGWLVFFWARRLFGATAGLFALALYALDPNVLAHAPLATSDSAAVFFLLASVTCFWLLLETPGWRAGLLSSIVFGLACVSKFSAVLLLPMFLLLAAISVFRQPAAAQAGWCGRLLAWLLMHGLVAVFIIWLFFGFRFSGFSPALPEAKHYIVSWENVIGLLGAQGPLIAFLHEHRLLPEAFLYGYSWVVISAQQRAAFLAGEYSVTGWLAFFPLAFWWKSTLALLAGLGVALALWVRRVLSTRTLRTDLWQTAPLLALLLVYGLFSLGSRLNIGHRHILPLYPVLYILLAGLAGGLRPLPRWRAALAGLLLAAQLGANVSVAPHYLAFFNRLAGGPAQGWRLLVDSSLDWGQDLPALRAWLDRHNPPPGAQRVYLSYFGTGEPAYYGIEAVSLPQFYDPQRITPWYRPGAGLYCISATMLQQVYSPVRGEWTLALEKEYQDGRLKESLFHEYWTNPAVRKELIDAGAALAFEETWRRYDLLRFARLCHYLRARGPDDQVGYSILIFRLTDAEIATALDRNYSEWQAAVTRAAEHR
jgi:4-amino-4-deoxy-L-arabinose transferase-like glycosyltransferase